MSGFWTDLDGSPLHISGDPHMSERTLALLREVMRLAVAHYSRPPAPTYRLLRGPDHDAILCVRCGAVSHHPADVWERYCGRCGVFHEDRREGC